MLLPTINTDSKIKLMPKKVRVLFVGEGISIAHVSRPFSLAQSLDKQEYEIHFATANNFQSFVTDPNFILHKIKTQSPEDLYGKVHRGKPLFDRKILKEYINSDTEILLKSQPDIVVSDLRLSMPISCELLNIPFISLTNGYWSPYTTLKRPIPDNPLCNLLGINISSLLMPSIFPIVFKKMIYAFIAERKALELKPLKHPYEAYTGSDTILYVDLPELTPTTSLPTNHHFIGPVLWEPQCTIPDWPLDKNKETVYLTLGSSGGIHHIEKLIDELLKLNYQVITTCSVQQRKHVYSQKLLPGLKVAQIADIFICHGGSGTIYQALSNGLPIVAICSNIDQQLAIKTLEQEGVAKSLLKKDATTEKIINMTQALLNNNNNQRFLKRIKKSVHQNKASHLFKTILKNTLSPK